MTYGAVLKVRSVADGQVEANLLQVTFSTLLNYLVISFPMQGWVEGLGMRPWLS